MTLVYHTPLSAAQQAVAGVDPVQPLAMADRVRFSELDVLNHVNNKTYFEWFERLRIRYSQDWGISNYAGRAGSPRIVIRSGAIHYRHEMHMDEDYIATCRCSEFRTNSYTLKQQVWSAGTLRATFDCVLVLLKPDGSGKFAIPDLIRDRFVAVDGAAQKG
ncbi:thioesterase family protein [Sulfitobacter sp. F26204]|uniref:acyl-CoA thioesterase n=1 Tax=Sulfitobacter sp. F26204 TaxID=2996014 RepID=UPI00225E00CA|nr:thioesterase family protein [Sulfitobacter sp. F26204]MCX7559835.1 thioesterase family protein [Sulfitobacter sp. F26204]